MSGIQNLVLGGGPSGPVVPQDPEFEYVTVLLPGNGTNGAQNNTFDDQSSNDYAITRNGNSAQGTFSPYSRADGNWSNYFDGTGDYLEFADNAALDMGTGDFTIEFWINYDSVDGYQTPYAKGYTSAGDLILQTSLGNGRLNVVTSGSIVITELVDAPINTWIHYALVRNGSTLTLYRNGTSAGSATNSTDLSSSGVLGIAAAASQSTKYPIFGYMSNVRVVKGTAVYTSSFTVPTSPLTAITNTSLLTCQSNRFKDNSSNNFTVTVFGNSAVRVNNPFEPSAAWSASNNGGSANLDGTGDYLTVSSLTFNPRTSVYTVEGWFYRNSGTTCMFFGSATDAGFYVSISSNNFYVGDGSQNVISAAGTGGPLKAWEYIALSFDGTTYNLYQNGTRIATTTSLLNSSTVSLAIGAYNNGTTLLNGYVSGVRFSNTARYTGTTMTVPTAPFASDANTSFLCNFTNAGIYDAAAMSNFETAGGAQISTTQSKFGGSSIYFDGTGDWIVSYNSTLTGQPSERFGRVFTIEFWMYRTGTGDNQWIVSTSSGYNNSTLNGLLIGYYPTQGAISIAGYNLGAYWFGGGTINTNTWYHVAVVGTSTACTIYIDGTSAATSNWPVGWTGFTTKGWVVGAGIQDDGNTATNPFTGYINDVRITNGVARYTSNFTPPTAAFPLL